MLPTETLANTYKVGELVLRQWLLQEQNCLISPQKRLPTL